MSTPPSVRETPTTGPGTGGAALAGEGNGRRRGRVVRRALAGAAVVLALAALALWEARRRHAERQPAAKHQPTSWRMANGSLAVLDPAGAPIFEHRWGSPLVDSTSSDSWRYDRGAPPVLFVDLDGDHRVEVVVTGRTQDPGGRAVYCFDADGTLRFRQQPAESRVFGDREHAGPWLAHRVHVSGRAGGSRRLWAVFTHGPESPSVLQELDPRSGAVRQEYWSNGPIEHVAESPLLGSPVVLVGGASADFRGGSLALFPADRVAGSAPSLDQAHACRNCASGGPAEFYVFPPLCVARREGRAVVVDARVEHGDRLRVTVSQGGRESGTASYTIRPGGALLDAGISREFRDRHALLERQHRVDHRFGRVDERDLFPVRRWDGDRFVELSRPLAR